MMRYIKEYYWHGFSVLLLLVLAADCLAVGQHAILFPDERQCLGPLQGYDISVWGTFEQQLGHNVRCLRLWESATDNCVNPPTSAHIGPPGPDWLDIGEEINPRLVSCYGRYFKPGHCYVGEMYVNHDCFTSPNGYTAMIQIPTQQCEPLDSHDDTLQ